MVVSRFVDHIPYWRQEQNNARSGVHTPRSTLAACSGHTGAPLLPLYDAHRAFVPGKANASVVAGQAIQRQATWTLGQRAASAITAMHTASAIFAVYAMLGRLAVHLKMQRPDAYADRPTAHTHRAGLG